jgi:hypothetical protein
MTLPEKSPENLVSLLVHTCLSALAAGVAALAEILVRKVNKRATNSYSLKMQRSCFRAGICHSSRHLQTLCWVKLTAQILLLRIQHLWPLSVTSAPKAVQESLLLSGTSCHYPLI